MIKRSEVVPGIYKNMCVCSDHFVGGSPSTLHDVNNQDRAPSLKLEVETVGESTLQARYKNKSGRRILKAGLKTKRIARKHVRNFFANAPPKLLHMYLCTRDISLSISI